MDFMTGRMRRMGFDHRHTPRRKQPFDITQRDVRVGASGSGTKIRLASKLLFGDVGTAASNVFQKAFNKNPYARPGFSGEKHIILPTQHGLTRANFAGPGTKLPQRLARRDKPVDGPRGIDAASRTHDIAYSRAKTVADIRHADNRMITDVRRSTAGRKTKAVVVAALRAKKLGEDVGVTDVNTFTQSVPQSELDKEPGPADRLLKRVLKKQRSPASGPAAGRGRHTGGTKRKRGDGLIGLAVSLLAPFIIKKIVGAFQKRGKKRKR